MSTRHTDILTAVGDEWPPRPVRHAFADDFTYDLAVEHWSREVRRVMLAQYRTVLSAVDVKVAAPDKALAAKLRQREYGRRWREANAAYQSQRVLAWIREHPEAKREHSKRAHRKRLERDGDEFRELLRERSRAAREKYGDEYNRRRREQRAARTPEQVAADAAHLKAWRQARKDRSA